MRICSHLFFFCFILRYLLIIHLTEKKYIHTIPGDLVMKYYITLKNPLRKCPSAFFNVRA